MASSLWKLALPLALWLSTAPTALADPFITVPPGWEQTINGEEWVVRSPADALGAVNVVVPLLEAIEGDLEAAVTAKANAVKAAAANLTRAEAPRYVADRRDQPVFIEFEADGSTGMTFVFYGQLARTMGFSERGDEVQLAIVIAPSAIVNAPAATDGRWQTALRLAEDYLMLSRQPTTIEALATASRPPVAPPAPPLAVSEPTPPAAEHPLIAVGKNGCTNYVAINNAIGQSFRVNSTTALEKIKVWIEPLDRKTSYKMELYDGEGTAGLHLADSPDLLELGNEQGQDATWHAFSFGGRSLEADHPYTFKLVRTSEYSGAFASCPQAPYSGGSWYYLGIHRDPSEDMAFELYGRPMTVEASASASDPPVNPPPAVSEPTPPAAEPPPTPAVSEPTPPAAERPLITVGIEGCTNKVAINNAIGQSFRVSSTIALEKIKVWIEPLDRKTSYKMELFDGEGTAGLRIADSPDLLELRDSDQGQAATWLAFSFGGRSLEADHPYTFKLVRTSEYSGAFASCPDPYPNGSSYWLGETRDSYSDVAFELYGTPATAVSEPTPPASVPTPEILPPAPLPPAAVSEPPAPVTEPSSGILWSGRGNGSGLALVTPCGADGAQVFAAVRRREYIQSVNVPTLLRDETRATIQQWTGATVPALDTALAVFGEKGTMLATVVEFQTAEGPQVGWFAVAKRSDNFVQRGYVVVPTALKDDQRTEIAINAVVEMMEREAYGELEIEGTPPAASEDTSVEAVFSYSRLAFGLEGGPLRSDPVEIAIFKNGGATETGSNLEGAWNRIPGGYSIEFSGGNGYIARVSDTCRKATTLASRPAPPPRVATGGARACFGSPITIDFPLAVGVESCSTVGGQRQCRTETAFRSNPSTVTGCR